jgi:hypothetical protein
VQFVAAGRRDIGDELGVSEALQAARDRLAERTGTQR